MREYRYSDPASDVTLSGGTEILLWPGKMVSLSKEHDYVKVLMALKCLMPEPEDTKPTATPAVQSPKHKSGSGSEVKTEDTHGS